MSIGSSILRPLFGSVRTLGISKCCKRPYSVTVLKGELCKINLSSTRWYSKSRNAGNENVSDTIVAINDDTLEDEPIVLDVVKEQSRISDGLLSSKYTEFRDEDAQVILDVEEERLIAEMQASMAAPSLGELEGISLERSVHGVFHTAEIVSILNSQKAQDVAVIELPSELGYADHMVIVSGRSSRHLLSMATFIRLVYKKKVLKDNSHAKIPVIEGKSKKNENWLALDLGNIVVHFFTKETREKYDLESLWALGPEFDPLLNNVDQDPVTTIMNKHSIYLGDLKPADSNL